MTIEETTLARVLQQGFAETTVRVRYAETDQMGVVYHANYLVWFEVGRVEYLRQIGLDYKRMELEEGAMIAVIEAKARYKAPARYDDELLVRTSLGGVRGSIVRLTYTVLRAADQTVLCEGETVHMVVGRDMKRRAMPERYAALFAEVLGHSHEDQPVTAQPATAGPAAK
jgi:acyl-CoA thioester hydrolase